MSKVKLASLLVAAVLVGATLLAPPAAQASYPCICEIVCWQQGTQWCWQDSCCHEFCCEMSDPYCSPPCF
jgi:hypothetical protein